MYNTIEIKSEHLRKNCSHLTEHEKYALHVRLDFMNNYLTVGAMAHDTGISIKTLFSLIEDGKKIHERITT